jgi:hypothetical protein
MSKIRLHIVSPGEARGPFSVYMAALVAHTTEAGIEVTPVNPLGSDLIAVRTTGVRRALENGATHILWIDSDILMKENAALRMLAHEKPVVAANYVMKTSELKPVTTNCEERISSVGKTGLESVTGIGMGFVLTDAEIYKKLRFPWFGHRWFFAGEKDPICIGPPENWDDWPASFEDAYFSDRIREAGYEIFIDHDLSREIGHYGGCIYFHDRIVSL